MDTIKKLSMMFQCVSCMERHPRAMMVTAKCGDRYCSECVKSLFMRSTKDEGLYPPKCCKQAIPLALVARHMDTNELATYQLAAVEFATQERVYCSNLSCGKFIVPDDIESGLQLASCSACGEWVPSW
jgi:late competence protein required for DNA uptake (superfamily II DNA/RNA helicase)